MTPTLPVENQIDRLKRWSLGVGVAGFIACGIGYAVAPQQFFRSYLMAYLFWVTIGLGCLPWLMIYHLVGGAWGFSIRRLLESGTRTILVLAILFLPILLGAKELYSWMHPEYVAASRALQEKHAYLNEPFFVLRTVFYFVFWFLLARRLNRWSGEQDTNTTESRAARLWRSLATCSGPGLAFYGLTLTFAVVDWAMSLEPEWYSSIYGMLWMVDTGLAALAFCIVVLAFLGDKPPLNRVVLPDHLQDLGNLLLASLMMWAYLAFSQLLIIWAGDLPEEIHWYLSRLQHGWEWVAAALIALQFFVPFCLLLSRQRKRERRRLGQVALFVLVMRVVDTYWMITPAFYPARITVHWLDGLALIGIGGIWLGFYAKQLNAMPLLPAHDPYVQAHKSV